MTPEAKQLIITLLHNGQSCQQVADTVYVSPTTVHRIISSLGPSLPRSHGGCPARLKAHDQQLLIQKLTSGAADTAPQVKKLMDLDVSTQTIRTDH